MTTFTIRKSVGSIYTAEEGEPRKIKNIWLWAVVNEAGLTVRYFTNETDAKLFIYDNRVR